MLTFKQYLVRSVVNHPSLYASSSMDITKFLVMDHAFNVIGTGIGSEIIRGVPAEETEVPEKYINGTPLVYVYDPSALYTSPRDQHYLGVMTVDEAQQIPGMSDEFYRCTGNADRQHPLQHVPRSKNAVRIPGDNGPYPNFTKEYSLVWRGVEHTDVTWNAITEERVIGETIAYEFCDLPHDWHEAAVDFYSQCLVYFQDHYTSSWYADAYRANEVRLAIKQADEMAAQLFRKYGKNYLRDCEIWYKIAEDYGVGFTGDTHQFLADCWNKRRHQIIQFIEETIAHVVAMQPR